MIRQKPTNTRPTESQSAGREKAISIDHNKRTVDRSGVNDFITKCVTGRINDSPSYYFIRLAFMCANGSCGKGARGALFGARGSAPRLVIVYQCKNQFVEIVAQLAPSDPPVNVTKEQFHTIPSLILEKSPFPATFRSSLFPATIAIVYQNDFTSIQHTDLL